MYLLLTSVHVLVCLFLIFVVLLQSAQAADLAGAFGGGGSQTALGMRGATTLLQKATTLAAVVFMITSLTLGIMGRRTSSLIEGIDGTGAPAPIEAPLGDEAQGTAPLDGAEQQEDPAGEGEQDEGEQASQQQGDEQQDAEQQGAGAQN